MNRLRAVAGMIACRWTGHRWASDWIWQRRCQRCGAVELRDFMRRGWLRVK